MSTWPDRLREGLEACGAGSRLRKYLVGVSGGADSMALLEGLKQLGYRKLVVCHLSHGLRPADAAREARLVRAAAVGLAFEHGRADTAGRARERGLSVETAAREVRLEFFRHCASRHRCRRVLLAHHADDQVETILLNLFRGTGLAGLGGMRPVSKVGSLELLRPMLSISREEVRGFAARRGLDFSEDPGNESPVHTRNRVRHELLPLVRRIFGRSADNAVLRMAATASLEEGFLSSQVPAFGPEVNLRELEALHPAIRARAILDWLRSCGVPEPGARETAAVLSLLDREAGPAKVNLPGGHHARRRAGRLFLEMPER